MEPIREAWITKPTTDKLLLYWFTKIDYNRTYYKGLSPVNVGIKHTLITA